MQDRDDKTDQDWLDLSGTSNRAPWPRPADLPQDHGDLRHLAAQIYGCPPRILHPLTRVPKATALLKSLPQQFRHVAVLSDVADEDIAALQASGRTVTRGDCLQSLREVDLAMVANPADPDGRSFEPAQLADLARQVRHLIVDESYADARPDLSMIHDLPVNVTVLRDMMPFWGLPLAFAASHLDLSVPISRPGDGVQRLAAQALADRDWAGNMVVWLAEAALYLDQIMTEEGARFMGGTHLFRLYALQDADQMVARLAQHRIKVARISRSPDRLRLAIPANLAEFDRLRAALA